MKKLLLMACALILGWGGVDAREWTCDLSKMFADGGTSKYDTETHVLSWEGSWSNSARVADLSGSLSIYDTFTIDATINAGEKYRLLFYEKGNSTAIQIHITQSGTYTSTFADAGISKEFLANFDFLRVSGSDVSASGNITINSLTMNGPDVVTYDPVTLYPENCLPLKNISGTSLSFPFTFSAWGDFWGSHDDNDTRYTDVTGYESMAIVVSSATNVQIRAFLWDTSRKIYFFHPESEYETVSDWTALYDGSASTGVYKVSLGGCPKLLGVKWQSGCSNAVVTGAYLVSSRAAENIRTYSSPFILDFTDVKGLKAYIVTDVSGNKVTLTEVKGAVPANTGLILVQDDANATLSIPTCGTSNVNVSGNLLVATEVKTEVPAGAYVLAGNGDELGWYSVGSTIPTLAAGKCYLNVPSSPAKQLEMVFDDVTTGVAAPVAKTQNSVYYNLQGVRVAQPTSGIYLKDGKKVIIKK